MTPSSVSLRKVANESISARRVTEIGQIDRLGIRHALDQLVGRHGHIDGVDLREAELGALADPRVLPLDPAVPLADLAVGQALETRPEMCRGGTKHFLGGPERSAADKVDFPHFVRSSHG